MHWALLTGLTLIIAAIGSFAISTLGIPGGMLMGGALTVSVAALSGFPATMPNGLRNVLFVCVGLSMGANVAPDTLQLIGQWPITLGALALELVVIVLVPIFPRFPAICLSSWRWLRRVSATQGRSLSSRCKG